MSLYESPGASGSRRSGRATASQAARSARRLFRQHIVATGFTPPRTYAELLLFVGYSGAPTLALQDAPERLRGIQIGAWVNVTQSERLTDYQRMLILAHEWCHWLRRHQCDGPARARFYQGYGPAGERDREEEIAREFERLFKQLWLDL